MEENTKLGDHNNLETNTLEEDEEVEDKNPFREAGAINSMVRSGLEERLLNGFEDKHPFHDTGAINPMARGGLEERYGDDIKIEVDNFCGKSPAKEFLDFESKKEDWSSPPIFDVYQDDGDDEFSKDDEDVNIDVFDEYLVDEQLESNLQQFKIVTAEQVERLCAEPCFKIMQFVLDNENKKVMKEFQNQEKIDFILPAKTAEFYRSNSFQLLSLHRSIPNNSIPILNSFKYTIDDYHEGYRVIAIGNPNFWKRSKKGWQSLTGQQVDRGKSQSTLLKLEDEFFQQGEN